MERIQIILNRDQFFKALRRCEVCDLHAPESGDDAGHGRRSGRRIQDGRCGSSEEADAEAGQQGDSIPQDRQLSLISRSFGSGLFVVLERKRIVVFALLRYHMEGL